MLLCQYKPVAPMDMPDEIRAFLLNEKMAKRDRRRGKQADDGSSSSQPPRALQTRCMQT